MNRTAASLALFSCLTWGLWAQDGTDPEADFFGEGTTTVSEAKVSTADPTAQFSQSAEGLRWGGTVTTDATWQPSFVGGYPGQSSAIWKDSLTYNLATTLFLDGRPDKDFRFRLSLKTGYPFTNDTKNVVTDPTPTSSSLDAGSTTLKVPNLKVWEMFTDVTVNDALFLRFGKQSASWGASYFYSPGDVISLTAKDAADPTAQREGPVALKATVPLAGLKANLTGFVLVRESYFVNELPSLVNLGYALQGDILVGDAQLSVGGFYQRDNAPKVVATLNTGLGWTNLPVVSSVNLFSEAVASYGSDVLKGSGTVTGGLGKPVFATVTKWAKTWYPTVTAGASYANSDLNLSLRGEYLYNPFGSDAADAAQRSFNTFIASAAGLYTSGNTAGRTYGASDASTPGVHNLTGLLSLSKLGGSKLAFSTLWQQNLSDASGWVKPSFTLNPWDQLGFTWGLSVVYGGSATQYPLQFQFYDPVTKQAVGTQRVTLNVGVTFGTGKY